MRLVQDITARQVYELPDYKGPVEQDVLLENLLAKHCVCSKDCRHPNRQIGVEHIGNLLVIDDATYMKRRTEILREMWRDFPDMSDADIMKAARDTYREDANKCFNRHNRPDQGCLDWKDGSKRIGSPSKSKMLAALNPVYLCDFCPVKSWVMTEQRHAAGMYKK